MYGGYKMNSDEKLAAMWVELASKTMRYADEIEADARGFTPEKLTKDEIVWRLRERRDLRREFMAACGECDDGYVSPQEIKFLRETEFFFEAVEAMYGVLPEEIEAAELPFTTADGRKTAVPLPTGMDI